MPITYAEVVAKVQSGDVSQRDAARWFTAGPSEAGRFAPSFHINEDEVDIRGVARVARASATELALRASLATRAPGGDIAALAERPADIVAEGDSWFNLPNLGPVVPKSLINFLQADYEITNIASPGDTLADVMLSGQYAKALEGGNVRILMLSVGGNDVLGRGHLAEFLKQRRSGDNDPASAPFYVLSSYYVMIAGLLADYAKLLQKVRQISPGTSVLVHGYDYCIPSTHGLWLGPPLTFKGFDPLGQKELCRAIVRLLVDYFNVHLAALVEPMPNTAYVDLRGTVKENEWWDELHPKESAARRLADKFRKKLGDPSAGARVVRQRARRRTAAPQPVS